MIKKKYIQFHIGNVLFNSHIDAVHAQAPNSDQFTGDIIKGVIDKIDASGIVAIISRNEMDINRPREKKNAPAIDEYRNAIKEIIVSKNILDSNGKLTKNYLHIAVHGMKDNEESEFEVGTFKGNSCSHKIEKWFVNKLKKISSKVSVNNVFTGEKSEINHREGDTKSGYSGYGKNFNTIQLEISRTWRKYKQNELIDFLSTIIIEFDKEFN